jgi:hypothetical protein
MPHRSKRHRVPNTRPGSLTRNFSYRATPFLLALSFICLLTACSGPTPGTVLDEASRANRAATSFNAADEDYFKPMDSGVELSPDEVKGRNTWIVWTGGNDRFWDTISRKSVGTLDFLKTVSSHPSLKYSRDNRWKYLGLVNEPCFEKATGPDPTRFGLWLDKRKTNCPLDPFANEKKYPGVAIGARGQNIPVGSFYGYPSGIIGLRLFPNPDFDAAAQKKWDPKRYYDDPTYYLSKDLVKPYRVGMSCAFCHVGPNPVKAPADPENPQWENLSSNVGAQYFWVDRIFDWSADSSSFVFQLFHTSRPGSLDTSLVSTDNINNPRTMNAVYNLSPRLQETQRWGKDASWARETLAGGGLDNRQFNDFVPVDNPLAQYFQKPTTVWTPRVLKDGSDSVGALGALNRVYLNIGLFSEEWLLHFNALVGGKPTSAIRIADARRNSSYWGATEQQTVDLALFFLKSTAPHYLKDAPNGSNYLSKDAAQLARGKTVFAERCARCHSSKLPEPAHDFAATGACAGANYLTCWNAYWKWSQTDEFKTRMREIVAKDDFLQDNFLSSEMRVPVTLLQTNACSPLATNAIENNIWDNFSSRSYKDLPSVGTITVHNPITGAALPYKMPAGGRGYTRPASLISLWSTAPFLLNNSVGHLNPAKDYTYNATEEYNPAPSVETRMAVFQESIEMLLWPEKRDRDSQIADFALDYDKLQGPRLPGVIDRTTTRSYLRVASGYLPDQLKALQDWNQRLLPGLFGPDGLEIGPIPAGTPVNLLANVDLLGEDHDPAAQVAHVAKVAKLLLTVKHDLENLPKYASDDEARKVLGNLVQPLLDVSKCPDFVVNRGHYFGTDYFDSEPGLSDPDKRALIELLKTF